MKIFFNVKNGEEQITAVAINADLDVDQNALIHEFNDHVATGLRINQNTLVKVTAECPKDCTEVDLLYTPGQNLNYEDINLLQKDLLQAVCLLLNQFDISDWSSHYSIKTTAGSILESMWFKSTLTIRDICIDASWDSLQNVIFQENGPEGHNCGYDFRDYNNGMIACTISNTDKTVMFWVNESDYFRLYYEQNQFRFELSNNCTIKREFIRYMIEKLVAKGEMSPEAAVHDAIKFCFDKMVSLNPTNVKRPIQIDNDEGVTVYDAGIFEIANVPYQTSEDFHLIYEAIDHPDSVEYQYSIREAHVSQWFLGLLFDEKTPVKHYHNPNLSDGESAFTNMA